jgi:hypothetical protein
LWKTVWSRTARSPSYPLLGIYAKRMKSVCQRDTCVSMFIAALLTTDKMWSQLKYPSVCEWIKKMRYMYTNEYFPAIKKSEILSFVAAKMKLEGI